MSLFNDSLSRSEPMLFHHNLFKELDKRDFLSDLKQEISLGMRLHGLKSGGEVKSILIQRVL